MAFWRHAGRTGLVMVALCIAACGGGSGGGASDGDPSSQEPVSGLLPIEPVAGVVLQETAQTLRPLQEQAVYIYHGSHSSRQPFGGYTNTVRQVIAGGVVREEYGNRYNAGPQTSEPLRFDGGSLRQREAWAWYPGGTQTMVDMVLLQSPVRVNARYVMLDRAGLDSAVDQDGDRVSDKVDVALWAQVVGEEIVDLPNRLAVKAVRVDTVMRRKTHFSRNPLRLGEVIDVKLSRWYAPGLGLVKTSRDTMSEDEPIVSHSVYEEVLDSARFADGGLGYTKTSAQRVPAGSERAGATITMLLDAAGFDDHAVVASRIPEPFVRGFALHHVDMDGRVIATHAYAMQDLLPPSLTFIEFVRAIRIGDELKVFLQGDDGLYMADFDATGQMLKAAPRRVMAEHSSTQMSDGNYGLAGTGDGFWVAWTSEAIAGSGSYALNLRKFDVSGQASGTATGTVELGVGGLVFAPLAANRDHAIQPIMQNTGANGFHTRSVVFGAGEVTVVADDGFSTWPDSGPCMDSLMAHSLATSFVLSCSGSEPAFIPLDSNFRALRDSAGAWREDRFVPSSIASFSAVLDSVADGGDGLVMRGDSTLPRWPDDVDTTFFLDNRFRLFSDIRITGGVPDAATFRMLARVPVSDGFEPARMLPMGNRVLVVGRSGDDLATMVVWR